MGSERYDIAVIGGGLAGLAMAIQASSAGFRTILFEKEKYPFHKVCGEYISLESWDFLESLGIPLSEMKLPIIRRLLVSATNGSALTHMMPLGGFGISRFKLDAMLAKIAFQKGVHISEDNKVQDIRFDGTTFSISHREGESTASIVFGAYGKRSNLDLQWKRTFTRRSSNKLNNYIAVKYHVEFPQDEDLISLHNFDHGYCGISRVENNMSCLCYLTTAKNLNRNGNSIRDLETNVLSQNPMLKEIFQRSKFLTAPVTISQVSFDKKSQVHDHIMMLGDAAGMITPLCGNGMSMALHASKLAFSSAALFLKGKISREELEEEYQQDWQKAFSRRLQTGRTIQRFFGNAFLSGILVRSLKPFPGIVDKLVSATHGQPF